MANGRFYVKRNGAELTDHPLNGATYGGTGAFIGRVNGYPVRDVLFVVRYAADGPENVIVTAGDVQDAPVMVKQWWSGRVTETFVFATAAQIAAAGKVMGPAFPDAEPEPAHQDEFDQHAAMDRADFDRVVA